MDSLRKSVCRGLLEQTLQPIFLRTISAKDHLTLTVEEAEQWVQSFVEHYNEHHRHRGIRMVTPGQRYRCEDAEVLRRRRETMLEARRNHPERWIGDSVLNCTPIGRVWLNPENGQLEEKRLPGAA